ncbi:prolipoprotein diacylglyceryl transferase [Chryseolinea sp. Jin1]|uniref:Phosphatidylglycerol--prolipoprotein diacylglyceryl transferase n=1 Tax=Chryseolinea lacunae TaxID=2801331 RepID=A0ABS1KX72_9BACT|nr:prolipoprotein diacylglyceryl transferase [Chryseolinea lacunae]
MPAYIIWDMNPDIFTIPFLNHPLRWYGILFAVGFFLGQQVMYYIYRKEGRSPGEIDTLTIYSVVATVLGARLGHVLFYDPAYYFSNPLKILATWEGGLASHGGVIGMAIALYLFARKTNVPFLWIVDRIAIAGCLAGAAIRMGNLTNSEMVGIPTTMPWGFIFTLVDDVPRHPAQLYEALYCLALFGLLFWMWFRFRDTMRNGFIFGWFLIILFSLRFVDEFLKVNQEAFEDTMVLNMGQLLSIPLVLTGIVILIVTARQKKARAEDELKEA